MNRSRNTRTSERRGTVLIFALAILAVLALLGATYVTRANLDRVAAEASAQRSSLERQPEAVVRHIRGLLTADLFGNKLVTATTPQSVSGNEVLVSAGAQPNQDDTVAITPSMFEDGEHWDYPSVDEVDYGDPQYTFGRPSDTDDFDNDPETIEAPRVESMLRYDASLEMFERAAPDDAWLASTEPVDYDGGEAIGSYDGAWDSWPQITNLRSVYRWDPDPLGEDGDGGAWVRDDGRFADLAAFFLSDRSETTGFGDPSADLLVREDRTSATPFYDPSDGNSVLNLSPNENSALLGVEQRNVYGRQMNMLDAWYEDGEMVHDEDDTFQPVDERFWADTDGDGRPDARWTVIDDLAGAEGLIWVAAARIVDSSAAVNVNTSLEGLTPDGAMPEVFIGDGTTPMDVDLRRLLQESATATNSSAGAGSDLRHPDVSGLPPQDLERGVSAHLTSGLGMNEDFIQATLDDYFMNNDRLSDLLAWDQAGANNDQQKGPTDLHYTTRAQREAYWRLFASRPRDPLVRGGVRYDLSEEVDLKAVWGANYPGVKSLESRFDGSAMPPRLPGQTPGYPAGDTLGPLRSAEFSDASSTFDEMAGPGTRRPDNMNDLTQREKIERIQKDVRRSLTVASGSSARSVVPALNTGAQSGRLKPLVNGPVDVEAAFEAFTWALAPLATNRPLMRRLMHPDPAMPGNDPWTTRYNMSFAVNPDFHYGGGANGPARAFATDIGLTDELDIGPAYALWRAASMAVNLRDAVDGRVDDPTTGAVNESLITSPTVARLFPTPEPNLGGALFQTALEGVIPLSTRFAHGDVDEAGANPTGAPGTVGGTPIIPDALSPQMFGTTFVGLDRQPFISEVFTMCLYIAEADASDYAGMEPPDPVDLSGLTIVEAGAIVGVELINPWDKPLVLDSADGPYRLKLADDNMNEIDFELVGTIPPGERFVMVWQNIDDTNVPDAVQALTDELDARGVLWESTHTLEQTGTDPFGGWGRTSALLYRDGFPSAGSQVLVDRLSEPSSGGEAFPATTGDLGPPATATVDPTGSVSMTIDDPSGGVFSTASNLARSSERPPMRGGFPLTVIENPAFNETHAVRSTSGAGSEGWHTDPANVVRDHFRLMNEDAPATPNNWADVFTLGDNTVNGSGPDPAMVEPFQLFVPDGKLLSAAELGMVSAFAHTYRHGSEEGPRVTAADADPDATTLRWRTASEELGKAYHLSYDVMMSNTDNPYLGVLDPTRFVLGQNGDLATVAGLPDTMAVPLALRVYDAFEALEDQDTALSESNALVEGRINLNTAPKRVLAALPLVLPVDYQNGTAPLMGLSSPNGYARLNAMVQYRERLGDAFNSGDAGLLWNSWNYATPHDLTQLTGASGGPEGLRVQYNETGGPLSPLPTAMGHRKGRGFASLGELSILTEWTGSVGTPPVPGSGISVGFLELAQNAANDQLNTSFRDPLDVRPLETIADFMPIDPTDDNEERLALFRGAANSASVRSDVFHAWYILRAYAPQDIEGIAVDPMMTDEERAALLNDLEPQFEHRGFIVLDRSNVQDPTDRPRVLLQTELDGTTSDN